MRETKYIQCFKSKDDNFRQNGQIFQTPEIDPYYLMKWFDEELSPLDCTVFDIWSSAANLVRNFQIHFSLELVDGFDHNQFSMKA